jgi:uncharacterized protein (DUF362 family)
MDTFDRPLSRRESLKQLLKITGGMAVSVTGGWVFSAPSPSGAETGKKRFIVQVTGREETAAFELVDKTFEAAGGMQRFIKRGDVVVIKPNVSWARRPDLAATTNPRVLERVIKLSFDAGAKKVRIAYNTIHDARRCFAITGVGQVAKDTDAELVFPRSSLMKDMKIRGHRLDVWPVFVPLIEADKVINLPVAKDHVLSSLTLGMKNWIGAVGGRRNALHQDIHQTIVDLAQFFNPTVTLIDATRIMTRNGPSGGSLSDVAVKNTLILSNDQVAGDALASRLFGYRPEEIGCVTLGQKWGLGTYDLQELDWKKVTL